MATKPHHDTKSMENKNQLSKLSQHQLLTIASEQSGRRLDNFLFYYYKKVPKPLIYKLIRKKAIRVNAKKSKPDYRLKEQDQIRIPYIDNLNQPKTTKASQSSITNLLANILFENNDFMIINKPCGMAVHGGSYVHSGLIEILRQARPKTPYLELGHRLDKDTSGCLVIAKKPSVLRKFHQLLRDRNIQKNYIALCLGHFSKKITPISAPLCKQITSGERMIKVNPGGKEAKTIFTTLEHFDGASLVNINLVTGRMHQIRVHSQYLGHPIACDNKYGDRAFNKIITQMGLKRLFLHANRIRFCSPITAEIIDINAPLDDRLTSLLRKLRQKPMDKQQSHEQNL